MWQSLDLKNCWASSRYEYGYIWILYFYLPTIKYIWFIPILWFKRYSVKMVALIFSSYPCSTHTTRFHWWFWFSEKIPHDIQLKEITFRLEFETTSRLRYIGVLFMIPPREIKLESS